MSFYWVPDKSKWYRFYGLVYHKFVETTHTVLLKNDRISGNLELQKNDLEEKWVYVSTLLIPHNVFPTSQVTVALADSAGATRVAPLVGVVTTTGR